MGLKICISVWLLQQDTKKSILHKNQKIYFHEITMFLSLLAVFFYYLVLNSKIFPHF